MEHATKPSVRQNSVARRRCYAAALVSRIVVDKTTGLSASKTFLVDMQDRPTYYFAKDSTSHQPHQRLCRHLAGRAHDVFKPAALPPSTARPTWRGHASN